ncbi:L,D-transpeptidase [Luteimonas sp. BDR2-5]|uniref:L,D-transpeptidase n=1 Tax=Proluteimonas luteida TaxID=2878685 RepID=UPI001E511843|nr:L,D-transpeptidase [Luteimonas sp. BDR2-5]MCD9029665.1 L,D-transpeptidase [Luteimonas sp. BDR2-5]
MRLHRSPVPTTLRALAVALALSLPSTVLAAGPVAAEATATRVPTPADLKPGEYLWHPEIAPDGPVVLVVSLDEQRAYVYRNGIAIGVSTISSGKTGHETPTGVFTILQKNRVHHSNLYNNASMPFMQRLTWDGIALHGGTLPGHPASHGCVRLPQQFAELLFGVTRNGDTVVVADAKASAAGLVHPAVLAPIASGGQPAAADAAAAGNGVVWTPEASPEGPVSVLVSLADQRVFVLRNGVAIGEAPLQVEPGFAVHGSVLMVAGDANPAQPDAAGTAQPSRHWAAYPVLGVDADSLAALQLRLMQRPLQVDPAFAAAVQGILAPGSTLLLTDLPAVRDTPAGQSWAPVLESDPASDEPAEPAPAPAAGS